MVAITRNMISILPEIYENMVGGHSHFSRILAFGAASIVLGRCRFGAIYTKCKDAPWSVGRIGSCHD
jgi:hypothetical protein